MKVKVDLFCQNYICRRPDVGQSYHMLVNTRSSQVVSLPRKDPKPNNPNLSKKSEPKVLVEDFKTLHLSQVLKFGGAGPTGGCIGAIGGPIEEHTRSLLGGSWGLSKYVDNRYEPYTNLAYPRYETTC